MKRLCDMTNEEQQALMRDMTAVLARVDPDDRITALFGLMVVTAKLQDLPPEEKAAFHARMLKRIQETKWP